MGSNPTASATDHEKAFSRSGCGRIFSLFSGVMRGELNTSPDARRLGRGLSGLVFSGPVAFVGLVIFP